MALLQHHARPQHKLLRGVLGARVAPHRLHAQHLLQHRGQVPAGGKERKGWELVQSVKEFDYMHGGFRMPSRPVQPAGSYRSRQVTVQSTARAPPTRPTCCAAATRCRGGPAGARGAGPVLGAPRPWCWGQPRCAARRRLHDEEAQALGSSVTKDGTMEGVLHGGLHTPHCSLRSRKRQHAAHHASQYSSSSSTRNACKPTISSCHSPQLRRPAVPN